MAQHKAGKLKQSNKKHKVPGSTKGSKDHRVQGRTETRKAPKKTNNALKAGNKLQRQNRQKQLMQEKRNALIQQRRLGANSGVPKIVGIVALHTAAFVDGFLKRLAVDDITVESAATSDTADMLDDDEDTSNIQHRYDITCPSQKLGYTMLTVDCDDPLYALDQLSVCDSVLVLIPHDKYTLLIDDAGHKALELLEQAGLPCASLILPDEDSHSYHSHRPLKGLADSLADALFAAFTSVPVIVAGDKQWPRTLHEVCARGIRWRTARSYMMADRVEVESVPGRPEACLLHVFGAIRGAPLYRHSLMHISGLGTARLVEVRSDGEVLQADPHKQDDGATLAEADTLLGEQTWPADQEMQAEEAAGEEDSEHDTDADDDEDEDEEGDAEDGREDAHEAAEDPEKLLQAYFSREYKSSGRGDESDREPQDDARPRGKAQEETEQDVLEDAVEAPLHQPARVRFARYRALRSLRTSYWHPKECLPTQYSRIFQFEDFRSLQRAAQLQCEKIAKMAPAAAATGSASSSSSSHGVSPQRLTCLAGSEDHLAAGQYVQLVLAVESHQAASEALARLPCLPVFALFEHETKYSVAHYSLQRLGASQEIVRSKRTILLHNGFRHFCVKPVYSQDNAFHSDKQLFLRCLPREGFSVATCIAPVSMTAQEPVLALFRPTDSTSLRLLARGALQAVDPDRIILKRIVLTGNPIRVRKRTAVVKHMFHDPMDVKWFKPAELVTANGLRGHIKCSVGTHGLYKALFSAAITQNDQVQLVLYKRVYPKLPSAEEEAAAVGHSPQTDDDCAIDSDGESEGQAAH